MSVCLLVEPVKFGSIVLDIVFVGPSVKGNDGIAWIGEEMRAYPNGTSISCTPRTDKSTEE
jgi:hypothetical protein